ncbi:MAG: class II aldolase/adducin family protein [Gemmatimonadaceae bacterium]|nr:class II aldolase/adducin family protein [Gemmatimonadaceae bacterium]
MAAPRVSASRSETAARREIVDVCRALAERRLIAGPDGNVSVRLDDDRVLCTPAGVRKGTLTPAMLVVVDLAGRPERCDARPASSEIGLHLAAYAARPEVAAVVHAHPPMATAWGVAGRDLVAPVLAEVILLMGAVPRVPFAIPGTPALAAAFAPFFPHHDAFLMANHGALTLGSTLALAHQRMECLEHAATVVHAASVLGPVTALSDAEATALRARRTAT